MIKKRIISVALLLGATTSADAALTFIDSNGNPVTEPAVFDSGMEAVYFTETMGSDGYIHYNVTNNTQDYFLTSFGVSNTDTFPWVGTASDTFGCASVWCYESSILDEANWGSQELDWDGTTGQDIFGDITNVLDPGDSMLNFYASADGELGPGDSWDGFLYGPGGLASQMFIVLNSQGGPLYGSGGEPLSAVPLPAAAWLMFSGLVGFASFARRRRQE